MLKFLVSAMLFLLTGSVIAFPSPEPDSDPEPEPDPPIRKRMPIPYRGRKIHIRQSEEGKINFEKCA